MINFNAGVVNDGHCRPDDQSTEDLEARGIMQRVDETYEPEGDDCDDD